MDLTCDLLLVAWTYAVLPIVGWLGYRRGWNAAKELYAQPPQGDGPDGWEMKNFMLVVPPRIICPEPSEN